MPVSVFDRTYRTYLSKIAGMDLGEIRDRLGAGFDGQALEVPVFGVPYKVSAKGIWGPKGERAPFDICVILSRYVLSCPEETPAGDDWVSFRDFQDAGPLTAYFSNDVEHAISLSFSGRIRELEDAVRRLEGRPPEMTLPYDMAAVMYALPRVPVLMTYNDGDDEFPPTCSVLFKRNAGAYLDAECLAMLARQLYQALLNDKEGASSTRERGSRP